MDRPGGWRAAFSVLVALILAVSGFAAPAAADTSLTACGPWLRSLDLPDKKIHSGGETQGTVKVSCKSPVPLVVAMTSADSSWVSVPDKVVVPAGATETTFPIRTHQPDYIYGELSISLTAKLRDRTLSGPLTLQPGLKFIDFGGHSAIVSGDNPFITVGLNGTAPAGGMVVELESDNPALQLPASITIPQGALGMNVPRPTSSRIPTDADVTVTAKVEGQSLTGAIKLLAWNYDPGNWSFTGSAEAYGGVYDTMALYLPNPVPHGGIKVTFSSDDPKLAEPHQPMQLAEGTTGTFQVPVSMPSNIDGNVTVTANIEGVGSRSQTVRVRPGIIGLDIEPMLVTGGEPFEGTVRLGTTTSSPVTVRLDSDNPAVQLPAEVTIPAGQSSVTFQGTTSPVTDFAFATVTASILGGSRSQTELFVEAAS
ncbi:hypothetical protein BTM25_04480 [Actinomadura rubteroloni]|uniref:Uncharacterized protein n=1 Tax=Actinomadura rubteroloni TaxID=1926885 RepID=A0A2P4ULY4_9ACTN|nr:hypothetical protein [Actinomadura rubteroloni]POM26063.1 hypothetical protein BTM25_04480 [Actinomadura rubteroloni]